MIANLVERVSRLVASTQRRALPPVQWETLRYLARANRFSATPGAVGLFLDATKGTVSQTVMALARKGLVRKEINRVDRRSVMLSLTPRGRALLAQDPLADIARVVRTLDPAVRTALGTGLATLLERLLAQRARRPFGQCKACRFFECAGGAPYRCGLLRVPLSAEDAEKICVEYERAA